MNKSEVMKRLESMGETACKVPPATDYIKKVKGLGRVGRKKKQARC